MERYYSQIVGKEIVTEHGHSAGRVLDVVVDPATGKVAGFLIAPRGQKVVAIADVLFLSNRLIIHDLDDVVDSKEIIKIQKILDKNIPIIKNKVLTQEGEYLGKVFDYSIDNKFFVLNKILVAKNFMGLFPHDEKIIVHKNILEIKKEAIIVKSTLELTPIKEKKTGEAKGKLSIDTAPTPS